MVLDERRVAALLSAHLGKDERILGRCHGVEQPWWTHVVRVASLFARHWLVVATDERLLLVELSRQLREKTFVELPWTAVEGIDAGRGVLVRRLTLTTQGARRRIHVARFSPLADNFTGALDVSRAFASRSVPAKVALAR